MRPVYLALSSLLGGKRGVLKFIVPFLKRYIKEREESDLEIEAPVSLKIYLLERLLNMPNA